MYENNFYNDFDFERYEKSRTEDYRTEFQRDRDSIVHSSAFRRLQSKTQVILSGEYDFYRTRLTHSLEVAQLGTSICRLLRYRQRDFFDRDWQIDRDLVEAICLAHDIGHPPFGHAGERALNKCMEEYGGFEGNAQTLRIITEIIRDKRDRREGMNPTRAFVDGVMKYKRLYTKEVTHECIYEEQIRCRDFVFSDADIYSHHEESTMNSIKSIECQIMDWADDIAYSLMDLSDLIRSRLLTLESIVSHAQEVHLSSDAREDLKALLSNDDMLKFTSDRIRAAMNATAVEEVTSPLNGLTNRYKYKLIIDPVVDNEIKFYRDMAKKLVFSSPNVRQLDEKGSMIVTSLFNRFMDFYCYDNKVSKNLGLLPHDLESQIRQLEDDKSIARRICDYLSGMSDSHAIRVYRRLFDPTFGSILDLI